MITRGSTFILLLLCAGSMPAQEKKDDSKAKEIDEKTIKKWSDRGYDHVPLTALPSGPEAVSFSDDQKGRVSRNELPGFKRRALPGDGRPEAPWPDPSPASDPGVPFALVLLTPRAGLSRLVDLESVAYLEVYTRNAQNDWARLGPGLEDADLEYVAELRSLTHLKLHNNGYIFGPGLKYLTPLEKLVYLDLSATGVAGGVWFRYLKDLPSLETLVLDSIGPKDAVNPHFGGLTLTNVALKGLKDLRQLKHLSLRWNRNLTDDGLKHLSGLDNLVALNLDSVSGTDACFSDAGLKHLSSLSKLTHLNLDHSAVTDAGLKELVALKNLRVLSLLGTKVTDDGVKALQKELPKCKVIK